MCAFRSLYKKYLALKKFFRPFKIELEKSLILYPIYKYILLKIKYISFLDLTNNTSPLNEFYRPDFGG